MSHRATIWAIQQRGLKPGAKLVLIQLADHHNPVNGCFPGQELLADECEMTVRSVHAHLKTLEERGLIRRIKHDEHGNRTRSDRYVFAFEDPEIGSESAPEDTQSTQPNAPSCDLNTGKNAQETPEKMRQKHRKNFPPNLVREPERETCDDHGGSIVMAFRGFWNAYPRPRDEGLSLRYFTEAVESGTDPLSIVTAAKRYRGEQAGNNPRYIAYSDNWLRDGRWRDYPAAQPCQSSLTEIAAFWAKRVKDRRYIAPNAIRVDVAAHMVSSGMVSEADLRDVGVRLS